MSVAPDRQDKFTAQHLIATQCAYCRHRSRSSPGVQPGCKAFPGGIPDPILTNRVSHRGPYEDDQGVRFSPRPDVAVALLDQVFRSIPS